MPKSKQEIELLKAYNELFPSLSIQGRVMGAPDAMISDAIHDIFLDLLEKKNVLEKIQNFKGYISISLRRKLAKTLKKEYSELEERHLNPQISYEQELVRQQQNSTRKDKIRNALEALTASQRLIITQRFYQGLSYEEIAEKQSIRIRTVYNQFHTAIKILREKDFFEQ